MKKSLISLDFIEMFLRLIFDELSITPRCMFEEIVPNCPDVLRLVNENVTFVKWQIFDILSYPP